MIIKEKHGSFWKTIFDSKELKLCRVEGRERRVGLTFLETPNDVETTNEEVFIEFDEEETEELQRYFENN